VVGVLGADDFRGLFAEVFRLAIFFRSRECFSGLRSEFSNLQCKTAFWCAFCDFAPWDFCARHRLGLVFVLCLNAVAASSLSFLIYAHRYLRIPLLRQIDRRP
jgi:hypothetical protein